MFYSERAGQQELVDADLTTCITQLPIKLPAHTANANLLADFWGTEHLLKPKTVNGGAQPFTMQIFLLYLLKVLKIKT